MQHVSTSPAELFPIMAVYRCILSENELESVFALLFKKNSPIRLYSNPNSPPATVCSPF